jgi:hypothetical protein
LPIPPRSCNTFQKTDIQSSIVFYLRGEVKKSKHIFTESAVVSGVHNIAKPNKKPVRRTVIKPETAKQTNKAIRTAFNVKASNLNTNPKTTPIIRTVNNIKNTETSLYE